MVSEYYVNICAQTCNCTLNNIYACILPFTFVENVLTGPGDLSSKVLFVNRKDNRNC